MATHKINVIANNHQKNLKLNNPGVRGEWGVRLQAPNQRYECAYGIPRLQGSAVGGCAYKARLP